MAPHYDDEVLGCGGLILQLAAAGAKVVCAFMSDGSGGAEERTVRRPAEGGSGCGRQGTRHRQRGASGLGRRFERWHARFLA
ncbi:MAG: PIG-L family deacetylase [Acidobacteria bacterium]|nr:PIG-L family deacetylase [Acidobacteriota bacterium]